MLSPENAQKYKAAALRELEIARALTNDEVSDYDTISAVTMAETYKKLEMQAEAEKIFEKAKKLTDPAIDFLIQLQKVIEE